MSIRTLELLRAVGLLDKNGRVAELSRFQPRHLQELLEYYAKDQLTNIGQDVQRNRTEAKNLSALVSSVSASSKPPSICPAALVFCRVYVEDPLFRLAIPVNEATSAHRSSMGLRPSSPPSASEVAAAVGYFASLGPLIRDGAVVVLPLHALHASPSEVPFYFSEDRFRSDVPQHLHDFVHQSAIIREVIPSPETGGMVVPDRPVERPTRMIAVGFRDDTRPIEEFFSLNDIHDLQWTDDRRVTCKFVHGEAPPSDEEFKVWVYQSINRAIIGRLEAVGKELATATNLGGVYLTESSFEANLFGMSIDRTTRAGSRVNAANFLAANSPSLNIDSADVVSHVRSDNPQLFERFQQALLAVASQLNGTDENFDERARQLFEAEVRPQLNELSTALAKVAAGIGSGTVLGTTSILMALLSGRNLPLGAVLGLGGAMAIGRALPSVAEFLSRRPGPAYIWNKIVK